MSWDYPSSSQAIVDTLEAVVVGVSVFDRPPPSFNPPAMIVAHPTLVTRNQPQFGIDLVTWPIICAVGADQADRLAELLDAAAGALETDPALFGIVQSTRAVSYQGWRIMDVSGIQVLAADLTIEIRQ